MKEKFLDMIRAEQRAHEAGKPAHIIAKMNQIQDPDICEALYAASQAGLKIDLIIRGFSILRPGLAGLSPTIRVISVIGRFLEHSRIFYFRNAEEDPVNGLSSRGRPTGWFGIWSPAWRRSLRSRPVTSGRGSGKYYNCLSPISGKPGTCSRTAAIFNEPPEMTCRTRQIRAYSRS